MDELTREEKAAVIETIDFRVLSEKMGDENVVLETPGEEDEQDPVLASAREKLRRQLDGG